MLQYICPLVSAFPRQSSDLKPADIYFGAKMSATNSHVYIGKMAEERVMKKLYSLGIRCERMGHKHPFDILLENGKRIDVKTCKKQTELTVGKHHYSVHRFNTAKNKKGLIYLVPLAENSLISQNIRGCL